MNAIQTILPACLRNRSRLGIGRFLADQQGATSVEYAVMLALIIGVCVVAVTAVGLATSQHWADSQNAIDTAFN